MSDKDQEQFAKVDFEKERLAILEDVVVHVEDMIALREPQGELTLKPLKLEGKELSTQALTKPADLQKGEKLRLAFSLESGQYVVSFTISRIIADKVLLLPVESEFLRLQRRSNFRVKLQVKNGVKFHLQSANGQKIKPEIISVIDLSAGGAKLTVAAGVSESWKQRTMIEGTLDALENRKFTLQARVVNVSLQGGAAFVGLEFQDVSSREQQQLLNACLALRRTFGTVFDI